VENYGYGGIMESFFCICMVEINKLNIASLNMVTKNKFEYDMWNTILISAKKFHWEHQIGKCHNQHQCVKKCL